MWNHLVEAASKKTGSMLIWDLGMYEVLRWEEVMGERETDDERDVNDDDDDDEAATLARGITKGAATQPQLLEQAFRRGKIRLRLHGSHLPAGYTISLRLSKDKGLTTQPAKLKTSALLKTRLKKLSRRGLKELASVTGLDTQTYNEDDFATSMNDASDAIEAANAYPNSSNTVGSIHQRWWFVSMDRANCGFMKEKSGDRKVTWTPKDEETKMKYPFYVRGREYEMSVVTGRKAEDVLEDEGVVGFVPRGGWKAALD